MQTLTGRAMIHVKPTTKHVVVYPLSRTKVPAEGITVADSSYWRRREAEGAVVIEKVQPQPIAATKPQPQESK